MKILLHACCGPCSIEPVESLMSAGHDITIFFSNSNIHPKDEYDLRLRTLLQWARARRIPVIEDIYNPQEWWSHVAPMDDVAPINNEHIQRCSACYHMRLSHAAQYAAGHNFEALSTTLAVSPYQLSEEIHHELVTQAHTYGITLVWIDWRPLYPDSVHDSIALGMYRQKYCGCAFSKAEAESQRAQIEKSRRMHRRVNEKMHA